MNLWPKKRKAPPVMLFADPKIGLELGKRISERHGVVSMRKKMALKRRDGLMKDYD